MATRSPDCPPTRPTSMVLICESAGTHPQIPRLLKSVARTRPMYVRLALWSLHHPAWVEGHTGGSRFTPTVHPCSLRGGGCGWPTCMSPIHHNKMRNSYMVAERQLQFHTASSAQYVPMQPRQQQLDHLDESALCAERRNDTNERSCSQSSHLKGHRGGA